MTKQQQPQILFLKNNQKKKIQREDTLVNKKHLKYISRTPLQLDSQSECQFLQALQQNLNWGLSQVGRERAALLGCMVAGMSGSTDKLSLCWFPDLGPGSTFSRSLIFEIQA